MSEALKQYFLVQYADDSQIILSAKVQDLDNLIKRGERALMEAKTYFKKNGLNVNEQKTQCIFMGSRQLIAQIPQDTKIFFGNTAIIPSKSVKNLGIYMDQIMLFDVHINHMSRKVNGILIMINKMKDRLDKDARLIIVQSLALSVINYSSRVWGMTTREQIDRVQKLQNFAAKIVQGSAKKYDHVSPILKYLK